jgi:catalase
MYLQTRRKQGNTEYRETTGQKRARRNEYLPHRCNHTHSDEDEEVLEKSENNYSVAVQEPFKIFERAHTRQTSSYYRKSAKMRQRTKLATNLVSNINGRLIIFYFYFCPG